MARQHLPFGIMHGQRGDARAVAPHLERDERDALRWLLPGAVLALLVSVASPAAFVTGFRVARRLKSTVAPNLRRASTGAASARRS